MYTNNHLAHRLRQSSTGYDDRVFAYLENGTQVTYGALFQQAQQYAQALISLGVTPGDRVAVQVHKSIEVVKLYLGTIIAGGVFLPLNTAYTPTEIKYFLSDATPTVFVCDPKCVSQLTEIAQQCAVKSVQTMDVQGMGTVFNLANAQSNTKYANTKYANTMRAVTRGKDDLGAILYTSGTTGRSKGAMLTHENLASNAIVLQQYWRFSRDDILIHALPIFHVHGLFVALNVILMAGASLRYMAKFNADSIMDAMPISTALMGVPTFYTRLLQQDRLCPEITQNMRVFISGSAPMLSETHTQWQQKTGHSIIERYGMTETGMNTSNPYDAERRAGTVGFALPGVEIRITDPKQDGVKVPLNKVGMLEVRGKNVFRGYWQMPEKTKQELRENGFFITGDLATRDAQGYISIVGRNKDLIISGGYNIYPKEVETIIDNVSGVMESAVIGVPHADFGEAVVAVVAVPPSHTVTERSIYDTVQQSLAKFKHPKKIYFINSLPRNTMGKVQKKVLRDKYNDTFVS